MNDPAPALNDKSSAAAYWDRRADAGYLPLSPLPYVVDRTRRLDEILINYIAAPDVKTVLDYGCGPGRQLARLSSKLPTKSYIGLDVSPKFLAGAKRDYPHITFALSTSTELDAGSVDLAMSVTTLAHIPDAEIPETLARLATYVRTDGRLLLFEQTSTTRHDGRMNSRRLAVEYEAWAASAGFALERRTLFHYALYEHVIARRFAPWYLRHRCEGNTAEERWTKANRSPVFKAIARLAVVMSGNPLRDGASGFGYTMFVFRRRA